VTAFEAGLAVNMLMQWCGLNFMARKSWAGIPATTLSLQGNLDGLTQAGLSVVVCEQTGHPMTHCGK